MKINNMTIKEKAEAYDKAFKIAQELYNNLNSSNVGKGYVCTVFPELVESRDEKIRKSLCKAIWTYIPTEEGQEYIAWLEKQAEQYVDISSFPKEQQVFMQPYVSLDKITLIKLLAERDANNAEIIESFEKQSEQKPADKVEPKFKVGDYVVGKYISGYITEVRDDCYLLGYQGFSIDKQNNYHLWTIQDAKDGDVLCTKNKCCPFIYDKRRYNNGLAYYYAGIDVSGNLNIKSPHNMLAHFGKFDNIRPATKEQRDTLMKAMTDAGYTFDFEKKELKKIEQKSQRMISAEAKEALYDKPAWSEEDTANKGTNAPTEYGKYVDECLNEASKHFFSEGEDTYSVADLFYAGVRCGKSWFENQGGIDNCPIEYSTNTVITDSKKNQVKPKFKIGNWITDGQLTCKVLSVMGKSYELHLYNDDYCHFGTDVQSIDENYHLWTIADAKPGDILHSTGWHNDCIFIFNGLDNWKFDESNGDRAVATGYCCLFVSADKMEFGIQGPDCIEVNTVKPATKEQHDLLFQKMKEAGYEWNAEKKELKKIEQKPTEWSEKTKGLDELETYILSIVPNRPLDAIKVDSKNIRFLINKEQKPAWSEGDEKIVKRIDSLLYAINESDFEDIHTWLESLKDRVQPKREWSEEDKQYFNFLEKLLVILQVKSTENEIKKRTNSNSEYYYKVIQWLKSLRHEKMFSESMKSEEEILRE